MIIVKLSGGLGNQLFQYATAKSIALHLNRRLGIDNSWYKTIHEIEDFSHVNATTKREYSLKYFNISSNTIKESFIKWISIVKIYSKSSKIFKIFSNLFLKRFIYKTINSEDYKLEEIETEKRVYLTGYWQNNSIIEKHRRLLLEELQLKKELSVANKAYLDNINGTNSIAIHFRRGDYISKPNSNKHHMNLTNQYYMDAIDHIKQMVSNPFFFIFSDEIDWVKNNVELPNNVKFIDSHGEAYEHLQLMSECNHFIIANSTFSWWGAWLCNNKNKIVISPKYWYNDLEINDKIIRIPEDWIKLNNINK